MKLKKYELNTISIEEQIESLGLSVDINKDIYIPFIRSLNKIRDIMEHFQQLELNQIISNQIENDPDLEIGDIAKLPDIMIDQLIRYHGLTIKMLDDMRVLHYNFSDNFGVYIDNKINSMNQTAYENLMAIENEINN